MVVEENKRQVWGNWLPLLQRKISDKSGATGCPFHNGKTTSSGQLAACKIWKNLSRVTPLGLGGRGRAFSEPPRPRPHPLCCDPGLSRAPAGPCREGSRALAACLGNWLPVLGKKNNKSVATGCRLEKKQQVPGNWLPLCKKHKRGPGGAPLCPAGSGGDFSEPP
jgi:hypothetical protein